jgi:L-lactate dehydrogenase (cytochrome)
VVKEYVKLNPINLSDFETAASQLLPPKPFARTSRLPVQQYIYKKSPVFKIGADDENTTQWNQLSWKFVRFHPLILPLNHHSWLHFLSTIFHRSPREQENWLIRKEKC